MSLADIRELRRKGKKPSGVVLVLIGPKPRWADDDGQLVVVAAHEDPRLMDWRPLVGLWVALLTGVGVAKARTLSVVEALEAAGAKFFGAADEHATYPLTVGAGVRHELALRRNWDLLCR